MTQTPSWNEILDLVKTWSDSGLESASLEIGDFSLKVSRSGTLAAPAAPSVSAPAAAPPTVAAGATIAAPAAAPLPGTAIPAPMIGVFYRSPAPGKPPYVEPGAVVEASTTIGLIEVMKLMSPVTAGVAGTLVGFDVSDGQQVEYGQTLARVEPT